MEFDGFKESLLTHCNLEIVRELALTPNSYSFDTDPPPSPPYLTKERFIVLMFIPCSTSKAKTYLENQRILWGQVVLYQRISEQFFSFRLYAPPDRSFLDYYKQTLPSCLSPGLISGILRYTSNSVLIKRLRTYLQIPFRSALLMAV